MTALVRELGEVVGVTGACAALGVPRPSYYRRCRPGPRRGPKEAAFATSRAVSERAAEGGRGAALGALRRSIARRGSRHATRRESLLLLRAHDVPDPGRVPTGARAPQSASAIPQLQQARTHGQRPEPGVVVGYNEVVAAEEMDVLLPLRPARHLQPLRGGLDGGRPENGELARRSLDRRDVHKQGVEPELLTLHSDRGSAP